jgi:hypothetical protein
MQTNARLVRLSDGGVESTIDIQAVASHVQVTSDHRIWIGYSDESVYGGSEQAKQGLVRLNSKGNRDFSFLECLQRFSPGTGFTDCYAMNVASNQETWVYFNDRSWDMAQIIEDNINMYVRGIEVEAARALAIRDTDIMFATNRVDLGQATVYTGNISAKSFRRWQVVDHKGSPLSVIDEIGRGARLFFRTLQGIYVLDVDSPA